MYAVILFAAALIFKSSPADHKPTHRSVSPPAAMQGGIRYARDTLNINLKIARPAESCLALRQRNFSVLKSLTGQASKFAARSLIDPGIAIWVHCYIVGFGGIVRDIKLHDAV